MFKKVVNFILIVCCITLLFKDVGFSAKQPDINTGAAILMDAETGQILYSKNLNKKMYPASVTKIMTALVAAENGFKAKKKVKASAEALSYMTSGAASIWIREDEVFTENQLMMASFLASANDAALVLAEKIGGSVPEFCNMMNEKAKQLGCKNTNFSNPTGLFDENQVTTVYDMALITQEAVKNKTVLKYFSAEKYTIPKTNKASEKRSLYTLHRMLGKAHYYYYDATVAGKTGWTTQSGNTLVTYCEKNDMKLICVMLGGNAGAAIYDETIALMDFGFDNYKRYEVDVSEYVDSDIELEDNRAYALIDNDMSKNDINVEVKEKIDNVTVKIEVPKAEDSSKSVVTKVINVVHNQQEENTAPVDNNSSEESNIDIFEKIKQHKNIVITAIVILLILLMIINRKRKIRERKRRHEAIRRKYRGNSL